MEIPVKLKEKVPDIFWDSRNCFSSKSIVPNIACFHTDRGTFRVGAYKDIDGYVVHQASELLLGRIDEDDYTITLFEDVDTIAKDDFIRNDDGVSFWTILGGDHVKKQFLEFMNNVTYKVSKRRNNV